MKSLSIHIPAVVVVSLLAGTNIAYAMGPPPGGIDHRAQALQIEQAVAAAKARASTVATEDAGKATKGHASGPGPIRGRLHPQTPSFRIYHERYRGDASSLLDGLK